MSMARPANARKVPLRGEADEPDRLEEARVNLAAGAFIRPGNAGDHAALELDVSDRLVADAFTGPGLMRASIGPASRIKLAGWAWCSSSAISDAAATARGHGWQTAIRCVPGPISLRKSIRCSMYSSSPKSPAAVGTSRAFCHSARNTSWSGNRVRIVPRSNVAKWPAKAAQSGCAADRTPQPSQNAAISRTVWRRLSPHEWAPRSADRDGLDLEGWVTMRDLERGDRLGHCEHRANREAVAPPHAPEHVRLQASEAERRAATDV